MLQRCLNHKVKVCKSDLLLVSYLLNDRPDVLQPHRLFYTCKIILQAGVQHLKHKAQCPVCEDFTLVLNNVGVFKVVGHEDPHHECLRRLKLPNFHDHITTSKFLVATQSRSAFPHLPLQTVEIVFVDLYSHNLLSFLFHTLHHRSKRAFSQDPQYLVVFRDGEGGG